MLSPTLRKLRNLACATLLLMPGLTGCMTFSDPDGKTDTGSKLGVSVGDDTSQIDAKMERERFQEKHVDVCDELKEKRDGCETGTERWTYHRHYFNLSLDEITFVLKDGVVQRIEWDANFIEVP